MTTKTANLKRTSANGSSASKNSKASNGAAPKKVKPKKSMYEKWIEKYGVDDSESGRLFLRAWHKTYDNHHKKAE